ncbi:fatty-acid amide hydrolase 2 isoform X2 [Fopius arisanus]|uniref:Fatty-acid amide hydrolase 2 isoform X2 n=1 Tax=Fopius arisanus TaxID=64838 RepID=A0A9R1U5B5_9HYME|nr:PREDICTED: fatty-acid amide hydrolase 2 isoform X2 [Fopius arisanus]
MEVLNAIIKRLIRVLLFLLSCLMIPLLRLRALRKQRRCPPIGNKILYMSATELAAKIRKRELACEEVVLAYIQRCRDVDPVLNAIVEDRFDEALEEARSIDVFLKSSDKPEETLKNETPLLGVPITVKESISLAGMSHAAGRRTKDRVLALNDSDAVRRAKKAGAIPLLVSNTPEMCMCWETFNNVTGTTWNPYDTNRTPGGSSGGEAALVSSAASILSIASDIGGSVRLPAMFCGIFGHKPTPEWIGADGHMPDCDDPAWPAFFTMGPMVRYSEDLNLFLKVLTRSSDAVARLNEEVQLSSIKYYYMEEIGSSAVGSIDGEIIRGMREFFKHLETVQGVKVQQIEIPEMTYAFEASASMLVQLDGVDTIFKKGANPREWRSVFMEFLRYITFMSPHTFPNLVYGVLKKVGNALPRSHTKWYEKKNDLIKKRLQEILGDDGVLIFPSFTSAAHYPYEIYHKICDTTYMMIFNSIGLPVTQCPMGLNRKGLPIGLQVVGNAGRDNLTIAVAREVERAFGGWQEPPSTEVVV